ncbi:MAG: transcription antitermination factor NusB [Flavobacteriales bacterium]
MKQTQRLALVNRRYLRIKIFQALYAYYRTEGADLQKLERETFESINKLFTLYLYLIRLVMDMEVVAREMIDQNKKKQLPTREDLNPNMRFVENRVFAILNQNASLEQMLERSKISWAEEHDDLRRIFKQFRTEDAYNLYMAREEAGFEVDKEILVTLFSEHLGLNEILHAALEEKDIYWQDDLPVAAIALIKTIQNLPDFDTSNTSILADVYKDKQEDQAFAKELLRKTVEFGADYEVLISSKADNWESERIALLDMILMKMALCELEHFPTVPVKVTLNEYIELAKVYSTPKSKVFINGVLDKLVADFKNDGRISKRGRGLME